jgi:hypothetical protein
VALLLSGPASAQRITHPLDPEGLAESRDGWSAIQAGHAQEAARHFRAAIARDADVSTYHLGAGVAAYQLGRNASARAFLEEALRLDGGLTPASVLLGQILHQQGDLDQAIQVYADALARAPGDKMLTARLEAWRKEAALHQDFQRSMSTNFTVLFEGPAEQPLADKALAVLEAAYWRIGGALGTYPPDVITVVLYTERQFQDVTRSPGWAGGLYDGRIRVPVRGALEHPEEFARVLSHELTHAFVYSLATRGVPQWLNEGLAGVFEQGDLSWARETVSGARALIPLDRLHGDFSGFSSDEARLAYAESALAAKYLLDRSGPAPVVALLTDLGNGAGFEAAFEQRILVPYRQFETDWAAQAR